VPAAYTQRADAEEAKSAEKTNKDFKMTPYIRFLAGMLLFWPICHAQDFLQQWKDSAAVAQKEFRAASSSAITQQGWRFLEGFSNAEGVPLADLFVKDVKRESGTVRFARVLTAFYQPASTSEGTSFKSSHAELSFDCAGKHVQQRSAAYFTTPDASGAPAASQTDASPQMHEPDPHTAEPALLAAVCAMQL
jgi:hypothetical protein